MSMLRPTAPENTQQNGVPIAQPVAERSCAGCPTSIRSQGVFIMSSIITETAKAARTGTDRGLQEVLDFLVTQELLSTTFLTAAIENAKGTPSAAFLPVLRNTVTTEFHHVEALRKVGGQPFTSRFWIPNAAFDKGGVGLFAAAEMVESVEISLYLIGVTAYTRAQDEKGARLCAEALGTEAVHRALVRFAQGQLGKDVGVPNDVRLRELRLADGSKRARGVGGSRHRIRRTRPRGGSLLRVSGRPGRSRVGTPVKRVDPR